MSKQGLSNLTGNYSHLKRITWQCGWFFHNIKQFPSTADCTSQKARLQADATLTVHLETHTVCEQSKEMICESKQMLSFTWHQRQHRAAECAHLARTNSCTALRAHSPVDSSLSHLICSRQCSFTCVSPSPSNSSSFPCNE